MGTIHQKKFLHAKCNGRKLWRGTGYSQHLKDSPHKLLSNNIFINREKEKRREQMWQNTTGGIWAPTVGSSLYSFWNFSLSVKLSKKKKVKGLPGGSVVKNLPANTGDSFNPWSWKIPHVTEQLSPCTTTIEPVLSSLHPAAAEALMP